MIIDVDGIPIELIRKSIKTINLRIYPPDGLVKVSVPLSYSEQLIRQHLSQKIAWINTHRERMRQRPDPQKERLENGTTIPFMGKSYLLILTEHNGPSCIKIDDQLIHCYTRPQASETEKQNLLNAWYRRKMEAILPDLITHWENHIGVKVYEWGIKKMKTRWGSCNTRAHRIWLNLSLIQKPLECLEYVLVHELIHLLEPSHNARFYALMTQYLPDWRERQKKLQPLGAGKDRAFN